MKLTSLIRFALDYIYKKKLNMIFVVIMCTVSIILVNLVIVEYYSINYEKRELNNIVNYNLKDIGYIRYSYNEIKNMDEKKSKILMDEIKNIEGIKQCGSFDDGNFLIEELYKNKEYLNIRKSIVDDMVEEMYGEFNEVYRSTMSQTLYKYSNILKIDRDMINLCNLNISKGKITMPKNNCIPLLIGYEYRDFIDIGQILTSKTNNKKYIVTGVLKKNSKWLINGDINNALNISINLDNVFVAIDDNMSNYDSSYIVFEKGENEYTRNKILKKIERINDKYKLNFKIITLEEIIKYMHRDMIIVSKSWIVLTIFSLIIGILSVSSVAIVTLLSRKRDIGILYAVGFSEKNICNIIVIENILQNGFGCVAGFCMALILSIYGISSFEIKRILDIQFKQGIAFAFGIFLLCTVIASIVPLIIVNKSKPSELIKE